MKDLDKNKVYSLEGIKKDKNKFNQLKYWLKKNDKGWGNKDFSRLEECIINIIYYNNGTKEWRYSDSKDNSICALTLFEDEFVSNTVIEVSDDGLEWLKRVLVMLKNDKAICWCMAKTIEEADKEMLTTSWKYYRNIQPKTILTKQQIADKFGNEETVRLSELPKKELKHDEVVLFPHSVTLKENKPTQYQIGIDTFTRAEANLSKEDILACVRFNIDKYTWRKKGQDKEDFEKIIAYAKWGLKNL